MLKEVFVLVLIIGFLLYLSTSYFYVRQVLRIQAHGTPGKAHYNRKATVHVVGKAAIADYLWLHILEGTVIDKLDGFYRVGSIETDRFTIRYLSGPGYIQTTIPHDIEYLVLILNGRSDSKKRDALLWLDNLYLLSNLKKVGLVLLGNEQCENGWILNYMRSHGGIVDFLFIVYDWKLVDNKNIFQWPLGVATYRGFPLVEDFPVSDASRKYLCNFVGTVYKNSSRSRLEQIMMDEQFTFNCVTGFRDKWSPSETSVTLFRYMSVLNNSDFTLCPAGKNPECYRIYEALSYGSIPVIEDVVTEGQCSSPLRLFKEYNAPFIYLNDWGHLNSVLNSAINKQDQVAKLRIENFIWYKSFRRLMRGKFIHVLKEKFFSHCDS